MDESKSRPDEVSGEKEERRVGLAPCATELFNFLTVFLKKVENQVTFSARVMFFIFMKYLCNFHYLFIDIFLRDFCNL